MLGNKVTCTTHSNEEFIALCTTCSKLICKLCLKDHKKHDFIDPDEAKSKLVEQDKEDTEKIKAFERIESNLLKEEKKASEKISKLKTALRKLEEAYIKNLIPVNLKIAKDQILTEKKKMKDNIIKRKDLCKKDNPFSYPDLLPRLSKTSINETQYEKEISIAQELLKRIEDEAKFISDHVSLIALINTPKIIKENKAIPKEDKEISDRITSILKIFGLDENSVLLSEGKCNWKPSTSSSLAEKQKCYFPTIDSLRVNDKDKNLVDSYHGTQVECLKSILTQGLTASKEILEKFNISKSRPEVDKVYTSPSFHYASLYTHMLHIGNYGYSVVCHMKQMNKTFAVMPETYGLGDKQLDSKFENKTLEWVAKDATAIVIVGIIMQEEKVKSELYAYSPSLISTVYPKWEFRKNIECVVCKQKVYYENSRKISANGCGCSIGIIELDFPVVSEDSNQCFDIGNDACYLFIIKYKGSFYERALNSNWKFDMEFHKISFGVNKIIYDKLKRRLVIINDNGISYLLNDSYFHIDEGKLFIQFATYAYLKIEALKGTEIPLNLINAIEG